MKAIQFHEFGDVDVLRLYRFTIGTPQIKIEEEELIAMIWLGFSS